MFIVSRKFSIYNSTVSFHSRKKTWGQVTRLLLGDAVKHKGFWPCRRSVFLSFTSKSQLFYLNKEQMTCIGFVFDVLYVYFMIVMLLVRLMGHLVLSVNLTSHKPGKWAVFSVKIYSSFITTQNMYKLNWAVSLLRPWLFNLSLLHLLNAFMQINDNWHFSKSENLRFKIPEIPNCN